MRATTNVKHIQRAGTCIAQGRAAILLTLLSLRPTRALEPIIYLREAELGTRVTYRP